MWTHRAGPVNDSRARDRVAIVGAGIGGLTAAVDLAARGVGVVLCEAGDAPGGKARHVDAGGRAVSAGPTVFTMPWVFEALFDAAGARMAEHLTLTRAEVLARHAWPDGSRLDLFADPARSEAAIADFAGGAEAARFRAFSARAARLFHALSPTFIEAQKPGMIDVARAIGPRVGLLRDMTPGLSLWHALERDLRDPRLRQLFARYATYVGGSPYLSPALLMLIWHAEAAGVWLVEGGIARVARALADLAAALGADIRYGAPVAEILVEGGRAAGLRLADGTRIAAGAVVFNGDVGALAAGHLGEGVRRAVAPVPVAARALSALTLTLQAEVRGFALHHHTVVFGADYRREFDEITRRRRLPSDPTVYLCAEDRGPRGEAPQGPDRLLLIINAPADGDVRRFDPEEIAACRSSAFHSLARAGLTLTPRPGSETATGPAEFERLFPGTGGALYGRAPHGMMASFRRPGARARLPGLYLAGGSVHPGAGVPMAAISGRLAAQAWAADRDSTSASRRGAISGGISTASATTARMPSR